MRVAISELRAHLREWIDKASGGDTVVITERGLPVAQLVPVDPGESLLDRLAREGLVTRATQPKRIATAADRVKAKGSVSEFIIQERDRRR